MKKPIFLIFLFTACLHAMEYEPTGKQENKAEEPTPMEIQTAAPKLTLPKSLLELSAQKFINEIHKYDPETLKAYINADAFNLAPELRNSIKTQLIEKYPDYLKGSAYLEYRIDATAHSHNIFFTKDGTKLFFTNANHTSYFIDIAKGEVLFRLDNAGNNAIMSPDEKFIATWGTFSGSSQNKMHIWNLSDGSLVNSKKWEVGRLEGEACFNGYNTNEILIFCKNTNNESKSIQAWNFTTDEIRPFITDLYTYSEFNFTPDQKKYSY